MPSNVEIKARVQDVQQLVNMVQRLSNSQGEKIVQQDTFFNVPEGRLKIRDFMNNQGQLIFYKRSDLSGPKLSKYSIYPTGDVKSLKALLSESCGVLGVVNKQRRLFLVGQTRIHVDLVEGLGPFVELEVVLEDGQDPVEGEAIAHKLMEELGIHPGDLVRGAYIDHLLKAISA